MSRYRQPHALSALDAAYIAGLVDGEGTISLSRRHARDRRQPVLSIANTERCLLDFVLRAVGAGKITRKRVVSDAHTPSFCYSISNRQALHVLAQIAPYLRGYKFARATLLLTEYVRLTPRNGKYTAELLRERNAFEARFLALRPASMSAESARVLTSSDDVAAS